MKIYRDRKKNFYEPKIYEHEIKICGLLLYKKIVKDGLVKKSWLLKLIKIEKSEFTYKFYIFGVLIYKRKLILKQLQKEIEKLHVRIENLSHSIPILTRIPFVHKHFAQFRRCNEGKDVILFAGGPSFDFYNNEIKNVVKFGVNGIVNKVFDLEYLFIEDIFIDDPLLNVYIDNYEGKNCKKFYGILPNNRLKDLGNFTRRITPNNFYNSKAYPFYLDSTYANSWAIDLEVEPFGDFAGAALSALQFIMFTHPRRVYLVGNDCTDQGLCYLSNRKKDAHHSVKIKYYKRFKTFADTVYPEIEIISINPVGLRGIFKDIYTQSFVDTYNKEMFGENITII